MVVVVVVVVVICWSVSLSFVSTSFHFLSGSWFSDTVDWASGRASGPFLSDELLCGYLSGVRCRLFAYGTADATVIPKSSHLLPYLSPDWFYLSGTGLEKRPLNGWYEFLNKLFSADMPLLN